MIVKWLNHYWKKILCFLITGSTALFIAACYGMPFYIFGHWTIKVKNKDNKPVKGLKVTIRQYIGEETKESNYLGYEWTDSTGTINFELQTPNQRALHKHEAIIQDVDSVTNGYYNDTLIVKTESDTSVVILTEKK